MSSYESVEGGGVPIKAWTRGVLLEDKAREQLVQTASLPIVGPHVAVMPDVHWGIGATVGSVVPTRGAVVPACVGVDIGCFVGDTRVPLLNGRQKSLRELAKETEPFWVYSVSKSGEFVPGRARCLKTRENAELMRVVVSGGDEIVCTPDHEFMMLDGTYRRADRLDFNDSLMPLYRQWASRDGYESVRTGPGRTPGRSGMTHLLVWRSIHGDAPEGYVVHHRNHIHFDNRPDNLELMTVSQHSAHHRAVGHSFDNFDPAFQRLRRIGIRRRANDPAQRVAMSEVGTRNIRAYMADRPEEFRAAVSGNGARGREYLINFNTTPRQCPDCEHVAKNPGALTWHRKREHGAPDQTAGSNHKVIASDRLTRREDVYCLQVEDHHNFALAAGVFVHNCGMIAARTGLTSSALSDNGQELFDAISRAVPHGRTDNGGANDRGAWGVVPDRVTAAWIDLGYDFAKLAIETRGDAMRPCRQLGTLGGGNHFVEVCLDEADRVWILLHSGSRGIGNTIGSQFIATAKRRCEREGIKLPNADLAWLPEGTPEFDSYIAAVSWAQEYARINRGVMLSNVIDALERVCGPVRSRLGATVVSCHHNYVSRETHFGEDLLITRKGAVSARAGELGIIPGAMGRQSFIVRGKGNADSFHSCSHGAGRVMSRGAAKKAISLEQHAADTEGVFCRKDADVLDESPRAYKDLSQVMLAQADLVDVVHELRAVVCVKG